MSGNQINGLVYAVIIIGCLSVASVRLYNYSQERALAKSSFSFTPGTDHAEARPFDENRTRLGFDISHCLIPKENILVGAGKNSIPALTNPELVNIPDVDFMEDQDIVIGVTIGDEAVAYPLRIMDWHEIVNHTVAGKAISITYCPLCRSALVFDRNIGGQIREFRVSGHLWNSNVLMYDRQDDPERESLWSQIKMAAVTGPASEEGLKLDLLPSTLSSWKEWTTAHPESKVLSINTGHQRAYRQKAYASYFASDRLMFQVKKHGEQPERFRNKEEMLLVKHNDSLKAYAVKDIAVATDSDNYLADKIADDTFCLRHFDDTNTVLVEKMDHKDAPVSIAYLYWFSLNAVLPEVEIYQPPNNNPES
jgi:hypothetical protein